MSIPKNKRELKQVISINSEKLILELKSIPSNTAREAKLPGHAKHTTMSVCDLTAYLIGWGELVLKWNRKKENNEAIDFPETGYKWNQLGELAQKFYDDYKKDSFDTLLKKLEKTVSEILKLIDSKTDKELYKTEWYDKWTLGRMIQLNTSSPYQNAKARVRKWKKINNII